MGNSIPTWPDAVKAIEANTDLVAGHSVPWASAEPGEYAVFYPTEQGWHAVYGHVPPPATGVAPYLLDAQIGKIISDPGNNTVAVPFTKK